MKKITAILLAVVMILSFAACAGGNTTTESGGDAESTHETQAESTALDTDSPNETPDAESPVSEPSEAPEQKPEGGKILVAYFSVTNNTEGVAQRLAEGLSADIYEIVPSEPYTDEDLDYGNSKSRSSVEMDNPSARPAISGSVENMEQYDVVFIGYPIWWGEAPRIMSTFIESYDFSGKTLVAFCTSGSSGFGSSDAALREGTYSSTWLEGRRFSAGASSEDVLAWVNGLEIQ